MQPKAAGLQLAGAERNRVASHVTTLTPQRRHKLEQGSMVLVRFDNCLTQFSAY